MSSMTQDQWGEAAAWMNLTWDQQPLEPEVAAAWYQHLRAFDYNDVLRAINNLVVTNPRRPSVAELVEATRSVVRGKGIKALPEPRPQPSAYREAWWALGVAVWEGRFPKADLDALTEKHGRYFAHSEDKVATKEMIEEVRALAESVADKPAVSRGGGLQSPRSRDGTYSDAHKQRYMKAVEDKKRKEMGLTA